jgi:hypothetical protein
MGKDPPVYTQPNFRIRSDDGQTLNADAGWHAALNNNGAALDAGKIFRVRFEVEETAGLGVNNTFKLQYNHEGGGWNDCTVFQGATTGPIIILNSDKYADGDATTNILAGSSATFVAGDGQESLATGTINIDSEHTEFEWCVMVMKFFDGPTVVADADEIILRVVEGDGTVFTGAYTNPTITVNMPDYFIGGTYVESPGRVGPFCDTNGNLYIPLEPSETDNLLTMIKSADGGKTWAEMDGANRPTASDLESVDCVQVTDTIHIGLNPGGAYSYHTFRMSDHATNPDTWDIKDETVATFSETDQAGALQPRDDGTVVAFYRRTEATFEKIYYKIRSSPGGTWGSENDLDTTASTHFTGVMCVKGESNKIHIFYKDTTNENVLHKSLTSGDSLSGPETVYSDPIQPGAGQQTSITTPVYWDSSGVEKIMVGILDESDTLLYTVVISDDGTPESAKVVSANTVNNDFATGRLPIADLVNDESDTYVLYSRVSDGSLYLDTASDDGGWGTDVLHRSPVTIGGAIAVIRGQVFTHSSGNGGAKVYGYTYEDSYTGPSAGYTGFIRYGEYEIEAAGGRVTKNTDPFNLGDRVGMSRTIPRIG